MRRPSTGSRGRGIAQPKDTARWKKLVLAGGLALTGLGGVFVANAIVLRAARGRSYDRPAEVPRKPVAIVLGARVHADGRPYPVLVDRLEAARALYAAGRVERVLVSGDHENEGYDEPNGMRRWLVAHGVPSEVVFMDHAGLRTLDTMERAARVFGVEEAVICTQRFHLARSVFLAGEAGIDAVGLVADRRVYRNARWNDARETLARTRAVLDAYLLGTEPKHVGAPIPVDGDARRTHDRWTRAGSPLPGTQRGK
jgi:SanA protein